MRRQDELVLLYSGQSSLPRKFLISQMEDLAGAFDSEELLEFLRGAVAAGEPGVAGQALFTLSRFLPGFLKRRYAISGTALGLWTKYGEATQTVRAEAKTAMEKATRAPAVGQAALLVLRPLIKGVMAALARSRGWDRTRGLLALSHFALASSQAWLADEWKHAGPSLELGIAIAEAHPDVAEALILPTLRASGADPDILLLPSVLGSAPAFEALAPAVDRAGLAGRINVALSLSGFPGMDMLPLIRKLWKHREPWVVVASLASLEAIGQRIHLPLVRTALAGAEHRFVKMQAVKAAGGIPGEDSIELCLGALGDADPGVCAAALESLIRLRTPIHQVRRAAEPFLTSAHLKARSNALIAALAPGEAVESPALSEMLFAAEPLSRLEAAHCLGYLQSPRALELLVALAVHDPSAPVRVQAVKALSRYPARDALPHVVPLFAAEDARLALTAARVLARYEDEEAALVCHALFTHVASSAQPRVRALSYWALGAAAARSGVDGARSALTEALDENDPTVLAGALEGWTMVGAAAEPRARKQLSNLAETLADPRLKARALLALWHSGEVASTDALGALASSSDTRAVEAAVECALEMGVLLPDVARGMRFPALSERLFTTTHASSFPELARADRTSFRLERVARLPPTSPEPEPAPPAASPLDAPDVSGSGVRKPSSRPVAARAASRPPPGAVRAPAKLEPDGLKRFLATIPAKEAGGSERVAAALSRVTYLIADGLSPGRLAHALGGTGRRIASAAALLAVSLTLYSLAPARGLVPPPVPKGYPGHVWVSTLYGACATSVGALGLNQPVQAGAVLTVPSGAGLILSTPAACRVVLKEDSQVTLQGVGTDESGGPVYHFREPMGDVLFEFRKDVAQPLELSFQKLSVRAHEAWIHVVSRDQPRSLCVIKGEAMLVKDGEALRLKLHQKVRTD